MPRIRTVKPEFFWNEALASCSCQARLLAIALLQLCDGQGVFRHIPMQIHAHAFPWEAEVNISVLLWELEEAGYLFTFEHGGRSYGWIEGFQRHQRLSGKEAQNGKVYPEPPMQPFENRHKPSKEKSDASPGSTPPPLGENGDAQEQGDSGTGEQGKYPPCGPPEGDGDGGQTNRPRSPPANSSAKKDPHPLFERWYEAYPVKKSRQKAVEAFNKIDPDEELVEQMLQALDNQKAEANWKRNAGHFVPEWPHPATWLNSERWKDESQPHPPPGAVAPATTSRATRSKEL